MSSPGTHVENLVLALDVDLTGMLDGIDQLDQPLPEGTEQSQRLPPPIRAQPLPQTIRKQIEKSPQHLSTLLKGQFGMKDVESRKEEAIRIAEALYALKDATAEVREAKDQLLAKPASPAWLEDALKLGLGPKPEHVRVMAGDVKHIDPTKEPIKHAVAEAVQAKEIPESEAERREMLSGMKITHGAEVISTERALSMLEEILKEVARKEDVPARIPPSVRVDRTVQDTIQHQDDVSRKLDLILEKILELQGAMPQTISLTTGKA